MNINNLFPSKYVKANDLGDKVVTVTIKEMTVERLGHGNEQEQKPVLWFTNATKGLVLNRTNAMIIASLYSPETDNWRGKQINLYAARVKAFGTWHDAVRVKEQIPARNVRQQPVPDALQEPPPIDDEEDILDVDEGQEPRQVDPETGEITGGSDGANPFEDAGHHRGTPPHQRLWGIGKAVLGPEWDMARPWIIRQWSRLTDPESDRQSASELSEDEKTQLGDYLNENASTVQKLWPQQRSIIVLNTLGRELYDHQWEQVRQRNVKRISGGETEECGELTQEQLQKLIAGMEKVRGARVPASLASN